MVGVNEAVAVVSGEPEAAEAGWAGAQAQLRRVGLVFPPLPKAMEPDFRRYGRWSWGSVELEPMGMYMFNSNDPFGQGSDIPADYIALSAAGHGVNSYAITYHLLRRPLAMLLQVGWDGVYMDRGEQERQWAQTCALATELLSLAERKRETGDARGRLGLLRCSELRGIASFVVLDDGPLAAGRLQDERWTYPSREAAGTRARGWLASAHMLGPA